MLTLVSHPSIVRHDVAAQLAVHAIDLERAPAAGEQHAEQLIPHGFDTVKFIGPAVVGPRNERRTVLGALMRAAQSTAPLPTRSC